MSPSDRPSPAHQRPSGVLARLRARLGRLERPRRMALVGGGAALAVVVVGGVVAGIALTGSPAAPRHRPRSTTTTTTTVKAHVTRVDHHLCPLTGVPAGHGTVPRRPAIGVKIGNDPNSRPQTGLLDADIVYEEMAEGGITRYLAVFQCRQAPVIGPVRSVRWDDWHVLHSFGHPILAFSGGIDQWDNVVAHLHWLYDANGSFYPMANAYYRTANRVPPWNYYTSTAALWKLDPTNRTPPPAQFRYAKDPAPTATRLRAATLVSFAGGLDVVWKWDSGAGAWERFYGSQPDTDSSGQQLHATNVVIQMVHTFPGPYPESGLTPDTISVTKGSGVAYVLRDGKLETGTWTTPKYGDTMDLRLPDGKPMALEPGTTWVEMVPNGYAVQFTR